MVCHYLVLVEHGGACGQPTAFQPARSRASEPAVDASSPSVSPLASRRSRSPASALPSSTPHWSKLLIPHSAPLTKTRCSYSAISAPSDRGVNRSSTSVVLGRLPGKLR